MIAEVQGKTHMGLMINCKALFSTIFIFPLEHMTVGLMLTSMAPLQLVYTTSNRLCRLAKLRPGKGDIKKEAPDTALRCDFHSFQEVL